MEPDVMYARATTTVTIYRGRTDDEWGDPKDVNTVVATGIPASIIESKTYAKGETTTQPRNIHYAKLRITQHNRELGINNGQFLRGNDRIYDEKTGVTWTILNISRLQNPAARQDLRADLMHVE